MAIRDKKKVLKGIREKSVSVGGKAYATFEIYFGTDGHGKKLRENRASLADARLRVEEFFSEHKRLGDAALVLGPAQVYDAKQALGMLQEAGLGAVCLTETARAYIAGTGSQSGCREKKLADAFAEYVDSIPDKQELHKKAVRARVGRWVQEFGPDRMVSEVGAVEVAAYCEPIKKRSFKSYNNALSYIKTFMAWCAKSERRYAQENPLGDMSTLKIAYSEPEFMPVADLERLIRDIEAGPAAAQTMPFIALSFFAGVRQEEIKRLIENRKDIDLNTETVRIAMPKGWTQGITPRIFQLQPVALAWLMKYEAEPVLCKSPTACISQMERTAKRLGINLGRNIGRHSFITYHASKFQNPAQTDAITGTSQKMRAAHYQGLACKADAERYFAIMPVQ
jgi:site-specific recombinase XerD